MAKAYAIWLDALVDCEAVIGFDKSDDETHFKFESHEQLMLFFLLVS